MRTLRGQASRSLMAVASCAFLLAVSVKLIDRPVATWAHEHLGLSRFVLFTASYDHHPLAIDPFSLMIGPAEALRPLAHAALAAIVLAVAAGWRPGPHGRIPLALSLSILVAMDISEAAQLVSGRTWPDSWLGNNPSWIRDGVFGFHPFHGGSGWEAFPSDHTAITTAPATVLWVVWPKLRLLWVTMAVIDMGGLIGANYHFVSDIIGGAYLGVAIGLGTAALMLSPRDCRNPPVARSSPPAGQISPAADAGQSTPDQA